MAVPVGPQIQHIDGAPGSTSTLRGDRITMYVESLTGTLSGAEGIPLPPAIRLHLTPDTVPEWLYDTVGRWTSSSNSAWTTPTSTRPDRQVENSSSQGSTDTERGAEAGSLPGLRWETDRFTVLETDRFLIPWRQS
ncbi:hypothetical protein [Streptomyces gilvus]|uniref:hypothetical protein n=1 Tax=Streptomyces gilvus TaxID=2920937 RepID=UPI001F115E90|nr:hypothetical protein [Streptomyces sp. CME 23]MCH5676861.1 hypothetical protein [Streptomyces sp. CME 23]